jgi:hypothetical protein
MSPDQARALTVMQLGQDVIVALLGEPSPHLDLRAAIETAGVAIRRAAVDLRRLRAAIPPPRDA